MSVTYPTAALGYRAWRVTPQKMLASTGRGATIWQPGDNRGYCAAGGDHLTPDEHCECGLYLYRDFDRAHAHARAVHQLTLVGGVAVRGRAFVAEAGMRVEQARVIAIALPKGKEHDPRDARRARLVAYRYQVPLLSWDHLPAACQRAVPLAPRPQDIWRSEHREARFTA